MFLISCVLFEAIAAPIASNQDPFHVITATRHTAKPSKSEHLSEHKAQPFLVGENLSSPYLPSINEDPTMVLMVQRPLPTSYLLSLAETSESQGQETETAYILSSHEKIGDLKEQIALPSPHQTSIFGPRIADESPQANPFYSLDSNDHCHDMTQLFNVTFSYTALVLILFLAFYQIWGRFVSRKRMYECEYLASDDRF